MRAIVAILLSTLAGISVADARGLGRLLGGMVARGAISSGAHAAASAVQAKSYTPNVLTVDQLVACLKKADALDRASEGLSERKAIIAAAGSVLDAEKSALERRQSNVD